MTGTQTKLAAGLSLVALGGFAGYALGAGAGDRPGATVAAQRQPLEVRTQTIHRTVRIVKHEKPPKPKRQAAPVAAPAAAPVRVVAVRPVQRVQQPVAAAPPVRQAPAPVRTRTSGGGSRAKEAEHEGGAEREGGDD